MKKIEAIVSQSELEIIRAAFLKSGISNMTVSEVREYGTDAKHTEIYRNEEYTVDSKLSYKVETIIPQDFVSQAIEIISRNRLKEDKKKGTILVSSVDNINT